jgi:hypothetical protein
MIHDWELFLLTKDRYELGPLGIVISSKIYAQKHCDSGHRITSIFLKREKRELVPDRG